MISILSLLYYLSIFSDTSKTLVRLEELLWMITTSPIHRDERSSLDISEFSSAEWTQAKWSTFNWGLKWISFIESIWRNVLTSLWRFWRMDLYGRHVIARNRPPWLNGLFVSNGPQPRTEKKMKAWERGLWLRESGGHVCQLKISKHRRHDLNFQPNKLGRIDTDCPVACDT